MSWYSDGSWATSATGSCSPRCGLRMYLWSWRWAGTPSQASKDRSGPSGSPLSAGRCRVATRVSPWSGGNGSGNTFGCASGRASTEALQRLCLALLLRTFGGGSTSRSSRSIRCAGFPFMSTEVLGTHRRLQVRRLGKWPRGTQRSPSTSRPCLCGVHHPLTKPISNHIELLLASCVRVNAQVPNYVFQVDPDVRDFLS